MTATARVAAVEWHAEPGFVYYILILGWLSAQGNSRLCMYYYNDEPVHWNDDDTGNWDDDYT